MTEYVVSVGGGHRIIYEFFSRWKKNSSYVLRILNIADNSSRCIL